MLVNKSQLWVNLVSQMVESCTVTFPEHNTYIAADRLKDTWAQLFVWTGKPSVQNSLSENLFPAMFFSILISDSGILYICIYGEKMEGRAGGMCVCSICLTAEVVPVLLTHLPSVEMIRANKMSFFLRSVAVASESVASAFFLGVL